MKNAIQYFGDNLPSSKILSFSDKINFEVMFDFLKLINFKSLDLQTK